MAEATGLLPRSAPVARARLIALLAPRRSVAARDVAHPCPAPVRAKKLGALLQLSATASKKGSSAICWCCCHRSSIAESSEGETARHAGSGIELGALQGRAAECPRAVVVTHYQGAESAGSEQGSRKGWPGLRAGQGAWGDRR